MKKLCALVCLALLLAGSARAADPRLAKTRLSVNFQNSDVSNLLRLVAAQTGLQLRSEGDLGVMVTLNQQNVTAQELLDRLSSDQQIEYTVEGNQLFVTKRAIGTLGSKGSVHHVQLKFAQAADVAAKLTPIVPAAEKLIIDDQANSLMFVGSELTWAKVAQVVGFLDVIPAQVLIEAQIVETSDTFLRDIGVGIGGSSNNGKHKVTANSGISADPVNLSYSGLVSGKAMNLDLKLAAAESKGEAKVISRPKVLTLNNRQAKIESGLSIYVKTLSTAIQNPAVESGSSSTGTPGLSATTGVTSVNAGLTLQILPTIVEKDLLRLQVTINNSQPDESSVVDGIPAVQSNAATTSIIVRSGETAIIAGLVKQTKSKNKGGVPVLRSLPVLGGLFGTDSQSDRNNELTIFITPTIEDGHLKFKTAAPAEAVSAVEASPAS